MDIQEQKNPNDKFFQLVCAPSQFDLLFDPSKSVAEFRDWAAVAQAVVSHRKKNKTQKTKITQK